MRSTWTDSRLDDFATETGRRFDRLEQHVDTGFGEVRSELREVRGEVSALHRTIIQLGVGMIVALIGLVATQL